VQHGVEIVEQYPVALAPPLAALRQQPFIVLESQLDLFGDRLDMAERSGPSR